MWNLLRCLLKTLVALFVDDVLISGSLTNTVAATVLIGVIATGVIGACIRTELPQCLEAAPIFCTVSQRLEAAPIWKRLEAAPTL